MFPAASIENQWIVVSLVSVKISSSSRMPADISCGDANVGRLPSSV
jgi:hypothetical protein